MHQPTTAEEWRRVAARMEMRCEIQPETLAGMKLAAGYARRSFYAWKRAIVLERQPVKFIVILNRGVTA